MMVKSTHKSWISPLLAVTFIAVSLTGILMLFHIRFPGMHPIHKWGGLLFVAAGVVHLLLNWKVFASYFKSSRGVWAASLSIAALILSVMVTPARDHKKIKQSVIGEYSSHYDERRGHRR